MDKNKTHLYAAYKRCKDTHRLKVKGCKKIIYANKNQKKAAVAVLISDKIDFKTKTNKRQRRTLHNDKGVNPTKVYNICKYLSTQHRST